MKNYLLLLVLICSISYANAQDIAFIEQDWDKAVALAKEQHKPILVDFYTDWCYWCKVTDKTTYKDKKVVDYINANFIPVKINAEKGYGVNLAMKYRVNGYPTFAYLNEDVRLVSKVAGYLETEEYLKMLESKLADIKTGAYYKGVSEKVELDYPEFYKNGFSRTTGGKRPDVKTVSDFLHSQPSLTTEVAFNVFYQFGADSTITQYFLEHQKDFEDLYGTDDVQNKVSRIISDKVNKAIVNKDEKILADAFALIDKYYTEGAEQTKVYYKMMYYEKTGEWMKLGTMVDEAIAKKEMMDEMVNQYSWSIYEQAEDKTIIEKATGWMSKVIQTSPLYAFMDTYAALLYKSGKYKEAEKAATKAIETGKKAGEDTKPTEELLVKIKDAKKRS